METKEKLSGRELDAVVHRLMGHDPVWGAVIYGDWMESSHSARRVPRYSTDIAAAMEVEDRIAELRRIAPYTQALWEITNADKLVSVALGRWYIAHAAAEQRCQAFLVAMETKDT